MGAAALAIAVGIAVAAGAVSFEVQTRSVAQVARGFIIVFLFFLIAGATEELIFRGFPFQALVHNLGGHWRSSSLRCSLGSRTFRIRMHRPSLRLTQSLRSVARFGLRHNAEPLARDRASLLMELRNGVYLWSAGKCFHMYDSLAWLRGHTGTPYWISGGSYGPEGGAAATVALILSTLAIWKSGLFAPSEEMLLAINMGNQSRLS